jgi:hypothetical protein
MRSSKFDSDQREALAEQGPSYRYPLRNSTAAVVEKIDPALVTRHTFRNKC